MRRAVAIVLIAVFLFSSVYVDESEAVAPAVVSALGSFIVGAGVTFLSDLAMEHVERNFYYKNIGNSRALIDEGGISRLTVDEVIATGKIPPKGTKYAYRFKASALGGLVSAVAGLGTSILINYVSDERVGSYEGISEVIFRDWGSGNLLQENVVTETMNPAFWVESSINPWRVVYHLNSLPDSSFYFYLKGRQGNSENSMEGCFYFRRVKVGSNYVWYLDYKNWAASEVKDLTLGPFTASELLGNEFVMDFDRVGNKYINRLRSSLGGDVTYTTSVVSYSKYGPSLWVFGSGINVNIRFYESCVIGDFTEQYVYTGEIPVEHREQVIDMGAVKATINKATQGEERYVYVYVGDSDSDVKGYEITDSSGVQDTTVVWGDVDVSMSPEGVVTWSRTGEGIQIDSVAIIVNGIRKATGLSFPGSYTLTDVMVGQDYEVIVEFTSQLGTMQKTVLWRAGEGTVETGEINWDRLINLGIAFTRKWPFSLPWDFVHIISLLSADPVPPKFEVALPYPTVGGMQTVGGEIDMTKIEPVMKYVRWFEIALFCMCLIIVVRRLYGGSV